MASYQWSREVLEKAFGFVVKKVMLSNPGTDAQNHVKIITVDVVCWCCLIVYKDTVCLCSCSCLSCFFQHNF